MKSECVFCKIIHGLVPAAIIEQNQDLIVIKDLYPQAPIHYLIIPKKHIAQFQDLSTEDENLMGKLLLQAQHLATLTPEAHNFNLRVNNGAAAGQCVFHIHIHFLAGKKLAEK